MTNDSDHVKDVQMLLCHRSTLFVPPSTITSRLSHTATSSRLARHLPGQNLSDRYKRLEKLLRGNVDLVGGTSKLARPINAPDPAHAYPNEMFRGFLVPEEPRPPEDDGKRSTRHNLRLTAWSSTQNVACQTVPYVYMTFTQSL